ncbi:DoxX family protein [Streptomyces cupreus]|uniref:DoxX family protein n=1 Tax=Streptomyces cupreus TaxID=2759956 RepID=A0A7X1M8Z0_9ACTN|nr:DoxX family protein [Streptomyces cupreus]
MSVVAAVLSVVVGALFVVTGGVKVIGLRQSLAVRDHFGMASGVWRAVGLLESVGGIGVLLGTKVTFLGLLALSGLTLLMLSAIASRFRVHDPAHLLLVDVTVLALVVATAATHLAG